MHLLPNEETLGSEFDNEDFERMCILTYLHLQKQSHSNN